MGDKYGDFFLDALPHASKAKKNGTSTKKIVCPVENAKEQGPEALLYC